MSEEYTRYAQDGQTRSRDLLEETSQAIERVAGSPMNLILTSNRSPREKYADACLQ